MPMETRRRTVNIAGEGMATGSIHRGETDSSEEGFPSTQPQSAGWGIVTQVPSESEPGDVQRHFGATVSQGLTSTQTRAAPVATAATRVSGDERRTPPPGGRPPHISHQGQHGIAYMSPRKRVYAAGLFPDGISVCARVNYTWSLG